MSAKVELFLYVMSNPTEKSQKCNKKNGSFYLIRHVRYRECKKISPKAVIHQLFLNIDFFN